MKKMFNTSILLLFMAISMTLQSCCAIWPTTKMVDSVSFETTKWHLQQLNGENIDSQPEESFFLIFDKEEGRFNGAGDCNLIGGEYVVTQTKAKRKQTLAGDIKFDKVRSTRRYCPNDDLERKFIEMINTIDSFSIEGNRLKLFNDGKLKGVLIEIKNNPTEPKAIR